MTRREWVKENMPRAYNEEFGGPVGCPHYATYNDMPDASIGYKCTEDNCKACWGKEMVPPEEEKKDMINPDHYKVHANECIEEIKAMLTPEEFRGFLKGNFLKYRYRTGHKDDPKQEDEKSDWYMNRLMKEEADGK